MGRRTSRGTGYRARSCVGDKVFLTTVVSDGEKAQPKERALPGPGRPDPGQGVHHWLVYCYDLKSGKELWKREAHAGEPRSAPLQE